MCGTRSPTSPHALLTENLCFRGTHVVKGKIHKALVIRVGDETQIGRLMAIDGAKKKPKSPISVEMERAQQVFIKMALFAGVFGAGMAWAVGVSFRSRVQVSRETQSKLYASRSAPWSSSMKCVGMTILSIGSY